jgi:mutator protein MutT
MDQLSPSESMQETDVAIAIVQKDGCYLVGLRAPGALLAGYAEFPGGKCQPGESPEQCAVRECLEETGIEVYVVTLRQVVVHDYPHGKVRIHFFACTPLEKGVPLDPFRWVERTELAKLSFPPANEAVVASLQGAP